MVERVKEMRRKDKVGRRQRHTRLLQFCLESTITASFPGELWTFLGVFTPIVPLLTNETEEAGFHGPQNAQQRLQVSF